MANDSSIHRRLFHKLYQASKRVVASRDIMERLSATSCDFYNENVFTFGVKMINYVYDDVLENINEFNKRF